MTPYLAALLLAASIAASYGVVSGIDAVIARVTSQPSRVERAAMVYARRSSTRCDSSCGISSARKLTKRSTNASGGGSDATQRPSSG